MDLLVILVVLAVVVVAVLGPLRRDRRPDEEAVSAERAELEAAREAKYREIRDAELDYRTGKLSGEDYELLTSALRAQAVEILDRLAALGGETAGAEAPGGETADGASRPGLP
jgi:flagellar biosynthesis/type III secretory pathway M-ring protein FliF/YscJ